MPNAMPTGISRGVFVTGTDTGVGKTVASACLVQRWHADYWKPAQTGLKSEPADTATVTSLAALPPNRIHKPRHEFAAPLSVEAAAALEKVAVQLEDFELPRTTRPLVVEGAGGVLVPLSPKLLMIDLMAHLALPIVLVARTALGTINHTLLSLAALRARNLPIAGIILAGPPFPGNKDAIIRHGAVRILLELPPLAPLSAASIAQTAASLPDFAAALPQ
jgi:malonyl-CoA O-methyltransferase